ncbi:hypothetical protein [Paenibacillus sp. FSL K6-2862]|uniref:hypothetical protein n=1 Tax=Paenibacillus sp. FSL K6-2862 TaxID=2921484 RepID=UPI0030F693A9
MSYTKPVIREPYYACPKWFDNDVHRSDYLTLSGKCTSSEVELFLIHLFGYSNTNIDQSMEDTFNELFANESVAILGGVAFYESEEKYIMPSCCCGLEQFKEIYNSILNRESPWLGHDPLPEITYKDNMAFVWSDDPDSNDRSDVFHIDFKFEEILSCLEQSQYDLKDFIDKPLFDWIYRRDQATANKMKDRMYEWFF